MDVRFKPHVTERRFKKLAYGSKTHDGLLSTWVGIDVRDDLDGQYRMADQARRLLGQDILIEVLRTTLGSVHTGVITSAALRFVCWRIAANTEQLLSDRPIVPWSGLRKQVVAPVQVVHTRFGWSSGDKKRPGAILSFRVIDGELCPVRFHRWFPSKFLYILAKDIGILSWKMDKPYQGRFAQLYGMRFVAQLAPSQYDRDAITIERHAAGQFESYNKHLLRRRAKDCPVGYQWECDRCTLGEDHCPDKKPVSRACRPVSLTVINCSLCGEGTWHDDGSCVRCWKRQPVSV